MDQFVEDELCILRLAVWRESHQLVFTGIYFESRVVGER